MVNKQVNDALTTNVTMDSFAKGLVPFKSPFRTEIIATDENGDVLFTMEHNMVVLGGAITVLEKMWNVTSSFETSTINKIMGITPDVKSGTAANDKYVCLWGVGCGGAGESFGNVRAVKFNENEIASRGHGTTEMLPFRTVANKLDTSNDTYFLRKLVTTNKSGNMYCYYGKRFADKDATIVTRLRDVPDGEDGKIVESENETLNTPYDIETYVEMHLTLTKKDVREWFEADGTIEQARINTIGLFTARRVQLKDGTYDYEDVKLFSKFNFDNEPLSNNKEINFTYRVYVS